jgi:alpha,alpha-trehalase
MEKDIAAIRALTGSSAEDIHRWETAAANRLVRMNELFWDPSTGLFYDWHLRHNERSDYAFATTFMPLWAGWATEKQAKAVAANLPGFLAPGGLLASRETTGCQWDAPFTWAPLVLMASRGLARYGFSREADDVALRFITLAAREFQRTGNLFEKYDARALTSDVTGKILFGYPTNEIGFGWTNGVIAELMGDRAPSRHTGNLLRYLRLLTRRTRRSPDGEKFLRDV